MSIKKKQTAVGKKSVTTKSAKKTKLVKHKSGLEHCKNLIDILRHMSVACEMMKKSGNETTAAIVERYADQICKIHNNQAVFMDALKRIMKTVQNRLDRTDAMVSVVATYLESAVTTPYTIEETNHLEDLIREIGKHL